MTLHLMADNMDIWVTPVVMALLGAIIVFVSIWWDGTRGE
jgi:hypothetical protein